MVCRLRIARLKQGSGEVFVKNWPGLPGLQERQWFADGAKAIAPATVAVGLWGFVTGVAMVKAGLTQYEAIVMSLVVYAGSAQLTALPLIMSGTPVWLIFLAGMMVNIRFVIFGAAMFPYFRSLSWPRRLWAGFFNGDLVFVIFMKRFGDDSVKGSSEQRWFYGGAAVTTWFGWQLPSIAGIFLGAAVPESWSLDFAATLALLAIVVPLVTTRPMVIAVTVASIVAWFGQLLPLRLGLVAAVLAAVAAGVMAEQYGTRRKSR